MAADPIRRRSAVRLDNQNRCEGSSAEGISVGFPAVGDPLVGTRIGNYLMVGVLGKGGMGVVYQAIDTQLMRKAAVKILPDSMSRDVPALRRFLREAKAAARIHHPNVVGIYEVGQRDRFHYIAMELVQGVSAEDLLRLRGPLNWQDALRWAADACRGLEAAHGAGLVHRDIKPANLVRGSDGVAKLLDFGLVKNTDPNDSAITQSGEVVGTPHYMSPEQCRSAVLDARSDLYSLGAALFEMLTGRPPYRGDAIEVINGHCNGPVPDPMAVDPKIPRGCAAIVRRAMAKDPGTRYQAARHMLADLEAALASDGEAPSSSVRRRPPDSLWDRIVMAVQLLMGRG